MYINNVSQKLLKSNYYAALAHLSSFLVLLLLYSYYSNSEKYVKASTFRYTIPGPQEFTDGCTSSGSAGQNDGVGQCFKEEIHGVPKKMPVSYNNITLCLFFFAFTALTHLFYLTDGFGKGTYSGFLAQGYNPIRWVEYAISASIMTILIAQNLGIHDLYHLISLVFINIALQTCGFVVESALKDGPGFNRQVVGGTTFAGWTLLLGLWIPIIFSFGSLLNDIKEKYADVVETVGPNAGKKIQIPGFVWFILIVQILNFSCFGFIQAMQVRDAFKGKIVNYESYERKYIGLSFIGKLGLASGLGYGLIFRTRKCP
jgi:hypothetical protein